MKACSRTRGEVEWGGQIVSALERQSLVVTNNGTARFKINRRTFYLSHEIKSRLNIGSFKS